MCRIAAYLGASISLEQFLRQPAHSLYRQSWEPREMLTAAVNADGYGVAWASPDDRPARYRSTLPVWADPNLDDLGASLNSRWWMGNVRSATEGLGTHTINTQPFCDDQLAFCHNGFITDFQHTLRRRIRLALDDEADGATVGNTDSEHIFALMRSQRTDIASALRRSLSLLAQWINEADTRALLCIAVTDGKTLYAVRSSVNAPPPSLYYHAAYPGQAGGCVVASEAFDDDPGWHPVAPDQMIQLRPGESPAIHPL